MHAGARGPHVARQLSTLADVMACSQVATELAREAGFSERGAWEVGIAVSELATNVTRHAGGGTIDVRLVRAPSLGIEIVAQDSGPGIDDVESAMKDDFSQGRILSDIVSPSDREGLGSGLGAVARLTDSLSIDTAPGIGTVVRAFKRLESAADEDTTPPPSAVRPVLILGLGNAILCDDGVGIQAVRHIAREGAHPGIELKEAEVAGFALLDLLDGYDTAVVIDAVRIRGAAPGEIVIFESGQLLPSLHLVAGHQIDLPSALEIGRQLNRHVPNTVHIVGVQVEDDRTFSERCTPAVETAIPAAAQAALEIAIAALSAG